MNGRAKLVTIECSTCSALREIYPQAVPGEPTRLWSMEDVVAMIDARSAKVSGETMVG